MSSLSLIKGAICLQKRFVLKKLDPQNTGSVDPKDVDEKIDYFVPSFFSGLIAYHFVDNDYKHLVALYTFSRALDIMWCDYKKKKGWETNSYEYGIIYLIMTTFITLAYMFEPNLMPESLYKLYVKFSSLTQQEVVQRNVLAYKFSVENFA